MARMARGEEVIESAMQAIANAVTVEQLRQAQAVVLPLRFAMSLQQTAEVTGLSVGWVSKQRNRFIQGKAVGDGTAPARGGRRRQNFTLQEEVRLWSKPERAAFWWSVKSSITLSKRWDARCRCRLFTRCCTATIGANWRRTSAMHKVTPWLRKSGKKARRNAPGPLQRLARQTDQVDVPGRSTIWTHP